MSNDTRFAPLSATAVERDLTPSRMGRWLAEMHAEEGTLRTVESTLVIQDFCFGMMLVTAQRVRDPVARVKAWQIVAAENQRRLAMAQSVGMLPKAAERVELGAKLDVLALAEELQAEAIAEGEDVAAYMLQQGNGRLNGRLRS